MNQISDILRAYMRIYTPLTSMGIFSPSPYFTTAHFSMINKVCNSLLLFPVLDCLEPSDIARRADCCMVFILRACSICVERRPVAHVALNLIGCPSRSVPALTARVAARSITQTAASEGAVMGGGSTGERSVGDSSSAKLVYGTWIAGTETACENGGGCAFAVESVFS